MDKKTEALKMAQAALAASDDFLFNYHDCEPNNEREVDAYSEIRANNMAAWEAVREALAEQPAQQEEIEELTNQRDFLADILTRTANALKGQPAELSAHSWHDLPELAQRLKAEQQQEPVACPKCKGLGYYDEGHECDDGSMAGGNYVECDKCKQPEFIKHEVENADDWSEWVCPDPKGYLMKCCDCGLVHEAQFGVVRYKSETEREDCDPVDDPNVQAVFRMRRSEQWSPADTAHRAGGLPMDEQPAQQQEPAAEITAEDMGRPFNAIRIGTHFYKEVPPVGTKLYTSPPASKPWVGLTRPERFEIEQAMSKYYDYRHECKTVCLPEFAAAIEAKLKEKNHG